MGEHQVCKKDAYMQCTIEGALLLATPDAGRQTAAHHVLCSKRAEEVKSYKLEV